MHVIISWKNIKIQLNNVKQTNNRENEIIKLHNKKKSKKGRKGNIKQVKEVKLWKDGRFIKINNCIKYK